MTALGINDYLDMPVKHAVFCQLERLVERSRFAAEKAKNSV